MSRAGLYGSLFTAVAVASLVSCARVNVAARDDPRATSPIHVNFSCDGGTNTIGFVDGAQNQAWEVKTKNREIEWIVPTNVTVDFVRAKSGDLPIDLDASRKKGKAKSNIPNGSKRYPYLIGLTCTPSAPGSTPVRLVIDPEMIIR